MLKAFATGSKLGEGPKNSKGPLKRFDTKVKNKTKKLSGDFVSKQVHFCSPNYFFSTFLCSDSIYNLLQPMLTWGRVK